MFTLEQVKAEIEAIAADNPDKVATCSYACDVDVRPMGAPVCIVGVWLHSHGVSLADLESIDRFWNSGTISDVYESVINSTVESESCPSVVNVINQVDSSAIKYLDQVQTRQDNGMRWGEAVNV